QAFHIEILKGVSRLSTRRKNMNVYDQAHGLAQAIKASQEFIQYDALKKQVDANPELAAMVKEVQAKQFELQAKQMMGEQMNAEMMAQAQQLYAIMMRDPLAMQYMEAQMRFSLMMNDVYKIIGEAVGIGDMADMLK
ncbi:MAG: YlbF family regulator, partial [Anaerovoracaceae bacterium]